MAKKKPEPALDPDAPRKLWLRCRVNAHEAQTVRLWLASLDAHAAAIAGQQIADRVTASAPFDGPGSLLRCVLGLPEIRRGAADGNRHHAGKRGANQHTRKPQ